MADSTPPPNDAALPPDGGKPGFVAAPDAPASQDPSSAGTATAEGANGAPPQGRSWRITVQPLNKGGRPSVLRFREFSRPILFVSPAKVRFEGAKPPRPVKVHVRPKTLVPQTLAREAESVSVAVADEPRPAPPPERSTPRLGAARGPVSSPDVQIADRPPPPERSTPRLGAARVEAPADEGETTLLTERRKNQLVANANKQPDENLYDVVGANTHRDLQVAADENSRKAWAAAVAARKQAPRISTTATPDTRWVPGALFAAGLLVMSLGAWLWHQKTNSRSPEVTVGALPAPGAPAGDAQPTSEEKPARAEPSAPIQVSAAPDTATARDLSESPNEAPAPAAASKPRSTASAPRASASQRPPAEKPVSSAPVSSAPPASSAASPGKKSADQSIFTEPPF